MPRVCPRMLREVDMPRARGMRAMFKPDRLKEDPLDDGALGLADSCEQGAMAWSIVAEYSSDTAFCANLLKRSISFEPSSESRAVSAVNLPESETALL
mmetsp:Transcript_101221/g.241373  ORF Transcript_101221/g.241373 Transcript_101221/m.241373 type:complete len:98 (-) Transcript_101221:291-584(-)